jgi:predicted porin
LENLEMKKTLVALAALAATSAFAQVTITGGFDVGYRVEDIKGNKVTTSAASNNTYTSNIVFAGTEDLGGGLKAAFRYEMDPALSETSSKTAGTSATGTTSNVTSSIGNGQSYLELTGGFGSIKLGTPNTSTLSANGDGNAGFGTAIGSGYRVTSFDAVRFQNTLRYDTPSFSGLSAGYLMGAKNDKQAATPASGNGVNQQYGRDNVQEVSLAYANGPLAVRYADLQTEQWASTLNLVAATTTAAAFAPTAVRGNGEKFKLKTLSAKYAVNKDLTVAYFNQKATSDVLDKANAAGTAPTDLKYDRKTSGLAAAYTMGATTFMVNRAQVKIGDETGGGTDNTKTTVTGLGVDYAMSKRTTAYFRNENTKDLAGVKAIAPGYTAATGNTTYKATAVGIRHTF